MTTHARGSGRRHRGRELALRVLFELEGTQKDASEVLTYQASDMGAAPDVAAFSRTLVQRCTEQREAVDAVLSQASTNWRLDDLGKVERAVLRLACCELLHLRDTPPAVVIDEAVELANVYAGEQAGSYVNGVLGRIARDRV